MSSLEIKLFEYLEEYQQSKDFRETAPYLFPGRHGRGHIHKASADRILREACRRLEIEGVSSHSFRRTALTWMSDAGVPLRHIQAISGHRSLGALERYLGVTEKQKKSARCRRQISSRSLLWISKRTSEEVGRANLGIE